MRMMSLVSQRIALGLVLLLLPGCVTASDAAAPAAGSAKGKPAEPPSWTRAPEDPPAPAKSAGIEAPAAPSVNASAYPWLADRTCGAQAIEEPIARKFKPPEGFSRVAVEPGSFGEWLRGLPLRPKGAVVDYRGRVILAEDDARLAAVVALDEGRADLQQCADSILRLFAEWQWSRGKRDESFRAASGAAMPFSKWIAGERPEADGRKLVWKRAAKPSDREDHGAFRRYLDAVFTWANTGALARDAAKTRVEELRPGDFFVLAGAPGHAVLVLDVASSKGGERRALLGQGYMPAQSFHVLRPSPGEVWFKVDPSAEGVDTPFWPVPFPWSSLRRLD